MLAFTCARACSDAPVFGHIAEVATGTMEPVFRGGLQYMPLLDSGWCHSSQFDRLLIVWLAVQS